MKKKIWFFFLIAIHAIQLVAQQYKTHVVKRGENIYRISLQYNVSEEAIYAINPGTKYGISEGQVLAIPVTNSIEFKTHEVRVGDTVYSLIRKYNISKSLFYKFNPDAVGGINLGQILRVGKINGTGKSTGLNSEDLEKTMLEKSKIQKPKIIRYITHRTRRRETVFSIAKKYDITVDDLKKYNKKLYVRSLKKRDRLRIPIYAREFKRPMPIESIDGDITSTTQYTIQPKDTRWRIARRHGISIKTLEQLNPKLDLSFPVGETIVVPTTYYIPFDKTIEKGFRLYEVPEKETIFNILKNTRITSDSLFKMNPYLKNGLKAGMVIQIPEQSLQALDSGLGTTTLEEKLNFEDRLYNFETKKIALMLPFDLGSFQLDVREDTENFLKQKRSRRIALDIYKGVMMAIDSAKSKGISTEISVFDTQKNKNTAHLKYLIEQNNFDAFQAVIGPLYQANAIQVSRLLKKYETPVFSPIAKNDETTETQANYFQTRPSDLLIQDRMISFVQKDTTTKNIVLIIEQGNRFEAIKEKLSRNFPEAKIAKIQGKNFVNEADIEEVLDPEIPNWVFLESKDVAMISTVTTFLNARAESHQVTLVTTDKNNAFEDDNVKNMHLSNLHMHYPSLDKEFDQHKDRFTCIKKYKKNHGVIPNKFIIRGFDIAYDILMRLGAADDIYHAASLKGTTEYIENKFNYVQKPFSGYTNESIYLIKFEKKLKLSLAE